MTLSVHIAMMRLMFYKLTPVCEQTGMFTAVSLIVKTQEQLANSTTGKKVNYGLFLCWATMQTLQSFYLWVVGFWKISILFLVLFRAIYMFPGRITFGVRHTDEQIH